MNCRDFDLIITSLAREQSLDGITCRQDLAHIDACTRCAARLAEERALLGGVQALGEDLAGVRASARVEAALLLAFHQRPASGSYVLQMPGKRQRARWMWGMATAAILALVSTILISWLHARSLNEHRPARESSGPVTCPPEQVVPAAGHNREVASVPRRARTIRRAIRHSDSATSEIATDFMPLLDGDDLDSLENSQLVRVELPGSALIAAGLPVDAEMADSPVKADVLLGHDGLARAIRFVR